MKSLIFPVITVISVGAILAFLTFSGASKNAPPKPDSAGSLASLQTGNLPWGTETATLKERLTATGLPALRSEGSVTHTHQHLDIFIEGKSVPVPAEIGVSNEAGFISPLHTHNSDGIIHVESPVVATFTLGQFLNVWGVRLDDNCLGGYCSAGDKKLKVFINGQEVPSSFANEKLEPYQEIVVAYGIESQLPNPLPKSYKFPPNY